MLNSLFWTTIFMVAAVLCGVMMGIDLEHKRQQREKKREEEERNQRYEKEEKDRQRRELMDYLSSQRSKRFQNYCMELKAALAKENTK